MSDVNPPEPPAYTPPAYTPPPAQPAYQALPQAYQQPVYGQQPYYAPAPPTNTLAIVSLILSLVGVGLGGIITGHIARKQIRERGEGGAGMALAGLIIGYIYTAIVVLYLLVVLLFVVIAGVGAAAAYSS